MKRRGLAGPDQSFFPTATAVFVGRNMECKKVFGAYTITFQAIASRGFISGK